MICAGVPPHPQVRRPPCGRAGSGDAGHLQYLVGALPDCVDELLNDQIDTFETGRFQLNDLLFHDGLKRQVWGEQARSEDAQGDRDRRTGETRQADRTTGGGQKDEDTDRQTGYCTVQR